ncbi:LysR family transcriptional regulator [Caproicibacter sp.]|uniref:LysR family transcriptional regulator n=1 Tax=Caproicibacter sp. TaxID=2814884 RepID=UPI0039896F02
MKDLPSMQELDNFIVYCKVQNFTLAAKQANITQSAFSFQMKKLEETLGTKLIFRNNRGSHLTPEGEYFYEKINKIMPELFQTIYELQQASSEKTLELKVGVMTSLGDILMNRHVNYYQQNNKNLFITVYSMEKDELIHSLNNGIIDIASAFLLEDSKVDSFGKTKFRTDNMVYYAPNINNLQDTVDIQTMMKYPLVKYPPNYFMSDVNERYFSRIGQMPVIAAQLSSPYSIIQYCQENRAGTLLTERLLNTMNVNTGEGYYAINPADSLNVYLVYKKDNPKYFGMKSFIDYIKSLYKE